MSKNNLQKKIQQIFDGVINEKNSFGSSLRVERGNGEIVFNDAGGNIGLESQFFIASTTKLFTTAIIYKLVDEGKIKLEDSLHNFFENEIIYGLNVYKGKDYSSSITVGQLLAHTSGIPDYFSGKGKDGVSLEERLMRGIDERWGFEKCLAYAKQQKAKFYPGQRGKALYSDTNFQILGRIIEIIRNKKIQEVFEEEVFENLGMQDTYYYTNTEDQNPISLYYNNSELRIPLAMSSFGPDGGIVSTNSDLMLFLKAFFQGKLFSTENLSVMKSKYNRIFPPLRYGIGIMMFQLPSIFTLFRKLPPLIGHSGLSGAFAFYCEEKDIYLAGTVNQIAARGRSYRMMIKVLQAIR
jgi:D-alanyl-D-alanine carboxypeptidase